MQASVQHQGPADAAPGWVECIRLTPPTLTDNTSDADRLTNALKKRLNTGAVKIDFALLRRLPLWLREWHYAARCLVFQDRSQWMLVDAAAIDSRRRFVGSAVDLGTSRVAMRLIDLMTLETLAERVMDNPQLTIGPDILTRIHYTDRVTDGLERLSRLSLRAVNQGLVDMCRSTGIQTDEISLMVLAGNTTMCHLFAAVTPRWIIREPYIPAVNTFPVARASTLGVDIQATAPVFIFPNKGSYVGGDIIAGVLHAGLGDAEEPSVLVDVGTNAEVVLGNRNWMVACAGAAGPALEQSVTRMGMMAAPGVIDRITLDRSKRQFQVRTIAGEPPNGICGSGLIDLAAQLFVNGLIDIRGRFVAEACGPLLKDEAGIPAIEIVPADASADGNPLRITQVDLDSLIRSKAAMYSILETITETVGMTPKDLNRLNVAGTFGAFIDPRSAIVIGMLPDLPLETYRTLGNSSLEGACHVLKNRRCLSEIERIAERITYVELNVNQAFMSRFSAARFLPHTDRALFPSVIKGSLDR